VLQQRGTEEGVGTPEHRGERDEQDRETIDHSIRMSWIVGP
jgi:hypothetical protein